VVFLSFRLEQEQIESYIAEVKKTPAGAECAYVAVLRASDQKNENIASSVIGGIDGFLFEPYAADSLREIAELTAKIKLSAENNRKKAAVALLLKEVQTHLDAVAFYTKKGGDSAVAKRKLAEASERLKRFKGEMFPLYVDAAVDFFDAVPAPISVSYAGVSERVKARLEAKMLAELEAQYKS
jgi:hypothetical protein